MGRILILRPFAYLIALVFALGPVVGCGIFDQYEKNSDGYYERHFYCCGPVALEKALEHLGKQIDKAELSKSMQDNGIAIKELLSFFYKDAICITWPSEMKAAAKKYGFEPITLVLVHSKLTDYHWVVFPTDDPKSYYGAETKIDKIYLLKKTQ